MRRNGVNPLRKPPAGKVLVYIGLNILLWGVCLTSAFGSAPSGPNAEVPVKGMVTLVAVCSEHCVPCKMMQPVLYKIEEDYKGRFALICVDKDKHKELAEKFKARVTPTLLFFDKDGKEVTRQEGVMDRKSTLKTLQKAGMQE